MSSTKLSAVLVYLTCVLALSQSCKNRQKNEKFYDKVKFINEASFPKHRLINFKETDVQMGAVLDLAVIDTFLIKSDLRDSIIIHLYGLHSKKLLKKLIVRGAGTHECLSVASILPTDKKGEFWCADISLKKLVKINISHALSEQNYVPEKEIVLSEELKGIKNISWVSDSLFVATSYAEPTKRLIYFNGKSKVQDRVGELPGYNTAHWPIENTGLSFYIRAMVYAANVEHHPEKDLSVVAYSTTDRIEFFRGHRSVHTLQGPDRFEPHYAFRNEGNSYTPVPDKSTKFANMGLITSREEIYCLYSGQDQMMTCGTKILVLDWNGKPKELLKMKNNYCTIAIDVHDGKRTIWSVDPASGKLIYATL